MRPVISQAKMHAQQLGYIALVHIGRGDPGMAGLTARLAAHEADRAQYAEWCGTSPQDGLSGGPIPAYQIRAVWEAMQNPGMLQKLHG